MTGLAVANFARRYAGMGEALDLETGRAAVAGVTLFSGMNVIDRLGGSTDPAAGSVTTRTLLGGVFEDAIQVALLAAQRGVNIFQDESGFGVIEQCLAGSGGGLGERRKKQCRTKKQRLYNCAALGFK